MSLLGAILAGGRSSRFGSDKALAEVGGHSLLELAIGQLAPMADRVVVMGRSEAPVATVPDRPRAGMGPLGGIAGALAYAGREGYAAVLTVPVDAFGLPRDLAERLALGPCMVAQQPVIGLWPVSLLPALDALLASDRSHSVRAFAELAAARSIALPTPPLNINHPRDLSQLRAGGTAGS